MIVQFVNQQSKYNLSEWRDLLGRVLPAALDATAAGRQLARQGMEAAVTVTFAGPRIMKKINAETRGIDSLTDVLSFPSLTAEEGRLTVTPGVEDCDPEYPEQLTVLLGDIIISLDRAYSQAVEYGHSDAREVAFLAVHGLLHLVGYDHLEPDQERRMNTKQKNILGRLGLERGNKNDN